MTEKTEIRTVHAAEITPGFLAGFSRSQAVEKCWRCRGGVWVVEDIAFREEWDATDLRRVARELRKTAENGCVFAAFSGGAVCGFSSVSAAFFGKSARYAQLVELQVDSRLRGRHLGTALFYAAADGARALGAEKLYISGHSSVETQAFYSAMDCTDACEINSKLYYLEPCDRHLEYRL